MKVAIVPSTDIQASDLRASTYVSGACDAAIRRLAAVAERDVPVLFSPHDAAAVLRELRDYKKRLRNAESSLTAVHAAIRKKYD